MMSVHGEAEQLKRSISAGAREFLVKPFSADEFSTSIRRVYERELARREQVSCRGSEPLPQIPLSATDLEEHQVIGVFSPKGGAGRTTIATNLALALHRETGGRVCLVDANLQFGDVGVLLNLNPKNRSMLDAVDAGEPDARDHQLGGHRPLDRDPRPPRAAFTGRRRPGHAGLPAQDGGSPARDP